MAARLRKTHQDDVREKIQASQIINRLMGHVSGDVELTSTQVRAAEVLLKKTLPDLQSTEVTGPDGEPVQLIQRLIVDEKTP